MSQVVEEDKYIGRVYSVYQMEYLILSHHEEDDCYIELFFETHIGASKFGLITDTIESYEKFKYKWKNELYRKIIPFEKF